MRAFVFAPFFAIAALACESCNNPQAGPVAHVRNIRRMQPDAYNATDGPKKQLEWGQLNFLHTTDTHGWLEGFVTCFLYFALLIEK